MDFLALSEKDDSEPYFPTLLVFANHDGVSTRHIAEFFALFGGGIRDAGWEAHRSSRARLAIVPGDAARGIAEAAGDDEDEEGAA